MTTRRTATATTTSSEIAEACAEIKTENPIEYVEFEEPHTIFLQEPNIVQHDDAIDDNMDLLTEIKTEPGIIDTNTLTCRYCNTIFSDHAFLAEHLLLHKENNIFLCSNCDFKCSTEEMLMSHTKILSAGRELKCVFCPETYLRKCDLYNHMREHRKNKDTIGSVGIQLAPNETPFSCPNCDYKCVTAERLEIHQKCNDDDKPIQCVLCKQNYVRKCDFYNHMKWHVTENRKNNVSGREMSLIPSVLLTSKAYAAVR